MIWHFYPWQTLSEFLSLYYPLAEVDQEPQSCVQRRLLEAERKRFLPRHRLIVS
jgi:hypothetical protein